MGIVQPYPPPKRKNKNGKKNSIFGAKIVPTLKRGLMQPYPPPKRKNRNGKKRDFRRKSCPQLEKWAACSPTHPQNSKTETEKTRFSAHKNCPKLEKWASCSPAHLQNTKKVENSNFGNKKACVLVVRRFSRFGVVSVSGAAAAKKWSESACFARAGLAPQIESFLLRTGEPSDRKLWFFRFWTKIAPLGRNKKSSKKIPSSRRRTP